VRIAAAACWAVLFAAGCQSEPPAASCQLQQQIAQTGTPLTLLPNARLDRVGGGFVLIGYDGQLVRWATVDLSGALGAEHSAALPALDAGPLFGVAGVHAAGDAIVIVYGVGVPGTTSVELRTLAVPSDGSGAPVGGATLATVDVSATGASLASRPFAMGSSRLGMRAALAWAPRGATAVKVQLLDGDGLPVGGAIAQPIDSMTPDVDCLGFVGGSSDLTIGYVTRLTAADRNPGWTIAEMRESGISDSSLKVKLGTMDPSCPLTAARPGGYVVAWQNDIGSWLGVYEGGAVNTFTSYLFAPAVSFGGSGLQPPLSGLGPVAGGDFAVVLAQAGGAEAWRVGSTGGPSKGVLVFPSAAGDMGQISAVPIGEALYATYPDYTSTGAAGNEGERFFIKVSCF
jgi:hypothetical protein